MINNKPVIGILPTSVFKKTDNPSDDYYSYTNTYVDTIVKCGGIPYFIPLVNEKIVENTLDICDGLFLPGGLYVKAINFDIIDYFYEKKKPILGVCLGMQELAMYSVRRVDPEKVIIKEIDTGVNHRPFEMTRDNHEILVHNIHIEKDSKLYRLFNKEDMMVNSLHRRTVTEVGPGFKIIAKSSDNLIEGLEYEGDDRYVFGVQFHPELIKSLYPIYSDFIDACKHF